MPLSDTERSDVLFELLDNNCKLRSDDVLVKLHVVLKAFSVLEELNVTELIYLIETDC